ncbi:MAG TPA: hypothetical protein VGA68_05780, partial [Woeseiaceae bacterium]
MNPAPFSSGVAVKKSKFEDGSYFLQRFLQSPKHIASVWPSSRFLAEQMFRDLVLFSGDVVIEYGPGTGSFTQRVERLRNAGVSVRYLGVEKDPGMYQYLTRRFPDLEFVLGDAVDVLEFCEARALPAATAVISGLPLILMNHRTVYGIFAATRDCLRADGVFRTFSYMHSYPSRRAGELRDLMRQCFEEYELSR